MSDVGMWDPKAGAAVGGSPDAAPPMDLVRKAASQLDVPGFGLEDAERAELTPWLTADTAVWERVGETADTTELVSWIRLFTLAETWLGVEAGAKSPVVPLARTLRQRGEYPADLTRWIKANTSNRFLPHGSLMDRLNA